MKSIFVSSTFRDMHEERDILHERLLMCDKEVIEV